MSGSDGTAGSTAGRKRKREGDESGDGSDGRAKAPRREADQAAGDYLRAVAQLQGTAVRYMGDEEESAAIVGEYLADPSEDDVSSTMEEDSTEVAVPRRSRRLVAKRRAVAAGGAPAAAQSADAPAGLDNQVLEEIAAFAATLRANARKTVPLQDRKPTFYTYLVWEGGKNLGGLFSATPQTDAIEESMPAEEADGSEFSMLDVAVAEEPVHSGRGKAPNLDRDRITSTAQGPHSLAHSLIDEMLKAAIPDDPALQPRERWEKLEQVFVSQVDTPDDFHTLVKGEFGEQMDDEDVDVRVNFALKRHQELFNGIEAALNGAYAELLLAERGRRGAPGSPAHGKWLADERKRFDEVRNLLGEIMNLAPFGSYSWHSGEDASPEELGGKGERRQPFIDARAALVMAVGQGEELGADHPAVVRMGQVLAKMVDGATGQFVDEEAYRGFLRLRFELAGLPEISDVLLELVLRAKQA